MQSVDIQKGAIVPLAGVTSRRLYQGLTIRVRVLKGHPGISIRNQVLFTKLLLVLVNIYRPPHSLTNCHVAFSFCIDEIRQILEVFCPRQAAG